MPYSSKSRYQRLLRRNQLLRQQLRQQRRLINQITSMAATADTNDIVIYGGTTVATTTVQQFVPVYTETYITPPPILRHDTPWAEDSDDDYSRPRQSHYFDD